MKKKIGKLKEWLNFHINIYLHTNINSVCNKLKILITPKQVTSVYSTGNLSIIKTRMKCERTIGSGTDKGKMLVELNIYDCLF